MVLLIETIGTGYERLLEWGDPRVAHFPLMGSPLPVLVLSMLYVLFVLKIGPSFMKNREPYDLKKTIIGYNILQIICNCIGVVWGGSHLFEVNILCTPLDTPNFATMHFMYLVLKVADLAETIFYVLRKKFNQITFLHLYHHLLMVLGTWATCKYVPGGQVFFIGILNVTVHAVMYVYYLLTAWDSKYKNSIWWKKHLTEMQITQHCMVLVSFLLPAIFRPDCNYPRAILIGGLPGILLMIYLFVDFYRKAYILKKPQNKE